MKRKLVFFMLVFYLQGYSQTWSVLNSGTSTDLWGVFALSPSIVYACGVNGILLKTTNGGLTWMPQTIGTSETLGCIYFTSAMNGFVIGNNGAAFRTIDGGAT